MSFDFDTQFTTMMQTNQLDCVIILGHMNPDGDCCGSVLGLAHYIHNTWPQIQVFPYLASNMDRGPKAYALQDTVFDPFTEPYLPADKTYAVICCDCATLKRLVGLALFEKAVTTMCLDHHAANEYYGTLNEVSISEACAENIYQMLDRAHLAAAVKAPHPNVADYLYLGIIHDTGCFDRANSELLQAASVLLSLGADHRTILNTRKTKTLEDKKKEGWLLDHSHRFLDDQVSYVCVNHIEAEEAGITYEDIHPISDILRDCADIQMAFFMFEESPDMWRCSFRSDGIWLNVNKLLHPFGGGGHAGASGLRMNTKEPEALLERILEQIKTMRK